MVLLWFVLFAVLFLFFYGLYELMSNLEYLMELWRNDREQRINMAQEAKRLNTSLLGAMYDLQADSMVARQALIRESFIAAQNERGSRPNSAENIEPDTYE
jgi:hypothetical protein